MSKATFFVSWDEVPHLTEKQKEQQLAGMPPWQRDSRTKGIPQIGAGAIYQVPESEFAIDPIPIPKHWPRVYGFDVGWRTSAAIFIAWDRETDTAYAYDEVYKGKTEPSTIARAIQMRGAWIPGVIDPAANGRMLDGTKVIDLYKDLGLKISDRVDNAVEAGILNVWQRLVEGRLKVFKTCPNLLAEYRIYRRDNNGKVVKKNDHALDALRYVIMSGLPRAIIDPGEDKSGAKWWEKSIAGSVGFCG